MKIAFTVILSGALILVTTSGCGVKGKPLAPIKKNENKNEPSQKQAP